MLSDNGLYWTRKILGQQVMPTIGENKVSDSVFYLQGSSVKRMQVDTTSLSFNFQSYFDTCPTPFVRPIQRNVFTAEPNAYGRSDYSGDLETQRIRSHFTVQRDDNFPNFLLFDTPFIKNASQPRHDRTSQSSD
jgi:hypothetical protein